MRAEDALAALRAFPPARFEDLAPHGGLVVIAPHADDESLGCGGLIAQAAARGRDARLVVVSDGTGSHPASRTHPPERLRETREHEALAAARVLGMAPDAVTFLRLPDRFVPREGPDAERAIGEIVRIARAAQASAIVTTSDMDPHCDHKASFALARAAARACGPDVSLWSYVIWGWTLPAQEEIARAPTRGLRLRVADELARKRLAVAQHSSQLGGLIDDDPSGFALSEADIARCCGEHEYYVAEPV